MKKLFVLALFAFLITPTFASFTESQTQEYDQVKQVLSSYSDTINAEFPWADDLIQDFVSEDHTNWTYQNMVNDLVNLILEIRSTNPSADDTASEASTDEFTPGQYESDEARPTNPTSAQINEWIEYNDLLISILNKDVQEYNNYSDQVIYSSIGMYEAKKLLADLVDHTSSLIWEVKSVWCFYDKCDLRDATVEYLEDSKSLYENEESDRLNAYYNSSDSVYTAKTNALNEALTQIDSKFTQAQEDFAMTIGYEIE